MTALSELITKADVEEGWKKDARAELSKYKAVVEAAEKLANSHNETNYTWGDTGVMSYEVTDDETRDQRVDNLFDALQDLKDFIAPLLKGK